MKNEALIKKYKKELIEYNLKANILSRKTTESNLNELINDTFELNKHLKTDYIIDIGSGNGILGVIIAILNTEKKIILLDSKKKKSGFFRTHNKIFKNQKYKYNKNGCFKSH